ncbi:MAG: methenyltetrahydromethanopterin cyclohydrolase [Asgard group archaeon]|nr:methenyltetrahydromethanopterin cyclohydrolase [Asgard group archaeon]
MKNQENMVIELSNPPIFESNMNEAAVDLFDEMLEMDTVLNGIMDETELGPTIFDLGIKAKGGYLAGEYTAQVCLGGLAEVSLDMKTYNQNLTLPTIIVITDFPAIATMGSQFAGWSINKDDYKAMASGPARIFAKKPKHIYEKLPIKDDHNETVIVLETNKLPNKTIMKYIAEKCKVELDCLCIIVAPTTSLAGATQIAGRSVETAIHKLMDLGMDVSTIVSGIGTCPIAPLSTKDDLMMGRTNDMLIYGSEVYLQIDYKNEKELTDFLSKVTSDKSKSYGSLFFDIVKKAQGDFYKIDPALFAPAKITVNNIQSGNVFTYGNIHTEMLLKSIQKV